MSKKVKNFNKDTQKCKSVNKAVTRFVIDLSLCNDKECQHCQSILNAFNELHQNKKI
jgi:hypothetical protein